MSTIIYLIPILHNVYSKVIFVFVTRNFQGVNCIFTTPRNTESASVCPCVCAYCFRLALASLLRRRLSSRVTALADPAGRGLSLQEASPCRCCCHQGPSSRLFVWFRNLFISTSGNTYNDWSTPGNSAFALFDVRGRPRRDTFVFDDGTMSFCCEMFTLF